MSFSVDGRKRGTETLESGARRRKRERERESAAAVVFLVVGQQKGKDCHRDLNVRELRRGGGDLVGDGLVDLVTWHMVIGCVKGSFDCCPVNVGGPGGLG